VDKLPLLENYLPGLCPARMRLPSSKLHRLPDGACGWQIEGRSAATSQRLKLPQFQGVRRLAAGLAHGLDTLFYGHQSAAMPQWCRVYTIHDFNKGFRLFKKAFNQT
jgi:hypothetical protein